MAGKVHLGFSAFAQEFVLAFVNGVNAGLLTACSKSFLFLAHKYGKHFLMVCGILFGIAMLFWFPVAAFVSLIDGIGNTSMGSRLPSAFSLFCQISQTMGPLLLIVLNWKTDAISEQFFFEELSEISPELSRKLKAIPPPPPAQLFKDSLWRYLNLIGAGVVLFFIGLLPGGPTFRSVLEAAFQFYLMSRVFGYYAVGGFAAVLRMVPDGVWAATGLPIRSWHITQLVKTFVLARSVVREILDPYVSRARYAILNQKKAGSGERRHVKTIEVDGILLGTVARRDIPTFVGFAFPYALLMSLPAVGPFVILFAQSAAAHLVRPLLTDFSRKQK
jgi:hypothetical protein